jgi:hypothetical protein
MAKRGRRGGQKNEDDNILRATGDIEKDFKQAIWDAAGKFKRTKRVRDLQKAAAEIPEELLWKEGKILSFGDFCNSPEHLDFPPLSERQERLAEYMFGDDPKKLFFNRRNIACLAWGKGSGKDKLSAMMILYVIYVLLNARNPQQLLSLPNNDSIDIINVAASKEQAERVFFQYLKSFIMNWNWLKTQWDIQISGRYFSSSQKNTVEEIINKVMITNDAIIFPHNIRAFSGSAEAETQEGHNVLMFVLDETDAFKSDSKVRSAEKIYRTFRTSANSRFPRGYWKGFMLSYPRTNKGFILKMYEKSKKSLRMYGDKAATWEVKPRELFSRHTFEFEGHDIPMDYYEEFMEDPLGSKRAYLCIAPDAETPFMEDWDRIEAAAVAERQPLFLFKDKVENGMVKKELIRYPHFPDRTTQYSLLLDLGLKKDATALTLMHREGDKVIMDFTTAWVPDPEPKNPKDRILVDLANVEEMILAVRDKVTVKDLWCDRWNSALLVQKLRSKGLRADVTKLDYDDYEKFKRLLYAGNIELLPHRRMLEEIKNLQLYGGKKVDHAPDGHNDLAVTVVMGVKILTTVGKAALSSNLAAEGEYVGDNMHTAVDVLDLDDGRSGQGLMVDGIPIT